MTYGTTYMILRRLHALVLLLLGVVLFAGGCRLLWLGGSGYYSGAGLAIIVAALLVWQADQRGVWIYGAVLTVTLAWAVWESGFDGWALAPRLTLLIALAVPFLRPVTVGAAGAGRFSAWPRAVYIGPLAAILVGSLAHFVRDDANADPLYQAGQAPWSGKAAQTGSRDSNDWLNYGKDLDGSRFSALEDIDTHNVGQLSVAWETHLEQGPEGRIGPSLETTPLKVGNTLYLCTAFNDVYALDAESGHINWHFRSRINRSGRAVANCRGVAYFQTPVPAGLCAQRIITNTVDARLIALDAHTGALCPDFGVAGQTDLNVGMGAPDIGYYYVSSAPTIVHNKVILGGWVSDGQRWGEPSGVIRAYDATSGKFAWAFDVGRPEIHAEPGPGETYTHSTPNSWAPMSADAELGLVYVPTGNPAVDYYGGLRRSFDERYGSAVIALEADTGAVRWSFQTTHHDLWDYDVASQPTLVNINQSGSIQRALVQPTKRGEIFLLDRVTGQPLATVEEKPAPKGEVPGEHYAPTQPFSVGMPSLGGARLAERDIWGLTPIDQLWCRIRFREARYAGTMTPPGLTPWIADPGILGGMEWGSASVDLDRSILVVNSSRISSYNVLLTRGEADALGVHPSVRGSARIIHGIFPQEGTPYAAKVAPFLSPIDVPCNQPPFGRVTAIDLRTHRLIWSKPLGSAHDSGPWGMRSLLPFQLGTPNMGGSLVTASGLIFLAATQEQAIRALDVTSGEQLWSARLPAGGQATPMTYRAAPSHRQFVVIAAGGRQGMQTTMGDSIIAFALPQ